MYVRSEGGGGVSGGGCWPLWATVVVLFLCGCGNEAAFVDTACGGCSSVREGGGAGGVGWDSSGRKQRNCTCVYNMSLNSILCYIVLLHNLYM